MQFRTSISVFHVRSATPDSAVISRPACSVFSASWVAPSPGSPRVLRDWSLITGRGGGYKMGKSRVRNFFAPPPSQDRVKLFTPPLLKSGNCSRPPYNMAKTSSYRVKTTQNFLCPPFSTANTFSAPPFRRGKSSRVPPSRFVAPPLPVISDQSLRSFKKRPRLLFDLLLASSLSVVG